MGFIINFGLIHELTVYNDIFQISDDTFTEPFSQIVKLLPNWSANVDILTQFQKKVRCLQKSSVIPQIFQRKQQILIQFHSILIILPFFS